MYIKISEDKAVKPVMDGGVVTNYTITETGEVTNVFTGRSLSKCEHKRGYWYVMISVCGERKHKFVHRLVAEAFLPNTLSGLQVNHKDGNKKNNNVSNLEWVTASQNRLHAFRIGLSDLKGESHTHNKLTNKSVLEMRNSLDSAQKLASKYNVSIRLVRLVRQRKRWAHI